MNEVDIPIDIHTGKLVDWLVSRRHCKKEWPDNVQLIREKINNAIQDMPEHPEITRLLSGTYINYFHCIKIVEILKETEKDSKNILGWYGSQRMKDWQEVVKLYERDSTYLAEAGQLLVRNVNFEIPGLKRQIAKGVQIQQECDRKVAECIKNAADAEKKYYQTCKNIGIKGEKLKHELVDLLHTLPEELNTIAESCMSLKEACQLYADFVAFAIDDKNTKCLPLLTYVIENGNVTTYEYTYGEAPCKIEEPQLDIVVEDEINSGEGNGIDFGDDPKDSAGIDFGDSAGGDIDWGNLASEEPVEIDWGIGEADDIKTDDIVIEDSGVAGGVARETEAMSLLYNPKTRGQFVDELHELQGFLKQRYTELDKEGSILSLSQFSTAARSVQDHSQEKLTEMLTQVNSAIAKLSTTKMQHLFLISTSPRYVDRVADSLRSKLAIVAKLTETQKTIKERKQTVAEEQRSLTPTLTLIIDRTKELQGHIQEDISKRYKGRPVNLMGINLSMQL